MKVREIMSTSPVCCSPDTPVPKIARLMCENDCGAIPVVDGQQDCVGVVTDRDIACRVVAQSFDARNIRARDCMSSPVVTVTSDTSVEECCQILEQNQLRRIIVVDSSGRCCGIVAQADIARSAPRPQAGDVVREISRPRRQPPCRKPEAWNDSFPRTLRA